MSTKRTAKRIPAAPRRKVASPQHTAPEASAAPIGGAGKSDAAGDDFYKDKLQIINDLHSGAFSNLETMNSDIRLMEKVLGEMKAHRDHVTPPSASTAAGMAKGDAATLPRKLSPLQCLIADLVGDVIVNGGQKEIVDALLNCAAMQDTYRTWSKVSDCKDDAEKLSKHVADTKFPDEWFAELTMEWRRNRSAQAQARTRPATALGRIRGAFLETLRECFNNSLTECTPEECHVMIDILQAHNSNNRLACAFDEMPLAVVLERALDNYQGEWVRVPASMQEQVNSCIKCLRAAQDCRPAA